MTPDQEPALKALSLHSKHVQLKARFGDFSGWQMPLWYGGAVEEHLAVRREWGVFDISHMGRLRVSGPDSGQILASLFSRDSRLLETDSSAYCLACNEAGGIVDDLIVYRLRAERFLVVCNAANADQIRQLIQDASSGSNADLEDLRQQDTDLLALQGPSAISSLARVFGQDLGQIGRHQCGEIEWDGSNFLLARTGYTGEDGFEILCHGTGGCRLWQGLIEAGCAPCGLAARDSLRLEASLALHGHEIDESTTPWEAGLGWAVSLEHEFRGKQALIESKDQASHRLASLAADGPGVIRAGFRINYDGKEAGSIASGGYSPMLKTSIAMAYLPRNLAKTGTALGVDLRGRELACHTIRRPFYRGSANPASE